MPNTGAKCFKIQMVHLQTVIQYWILKYTIRYIIEVFYGLLLPFLDCNLPSVFFFICSVAFIQPVTAKRVRTAYVLS